MHQGKMTGVFAKHGKSQSGCNMSDQTARTVFIKTFGCQMNDYDSEKMLETLGPAYRRVESAEDATLVIVNTCSVREKAENKLYSFLGTLRPRKLQQQDFLIGVGGCVAQQEGEEILKRCRYVDFVFGTQAISDLPRLVREAAQDAKRQVSVEMNAEWQDYDLPESALGAAVFSKLPALVAIQRGCDKYCAYCIVPYTRGPQVSRPENSVLEELQTKVSSGAREVLLLGQNVNSYGRDLSPPSSFARLLRKVSQVPGLSRIRFTSPHPQDVDEEFLDLYEDLPALCPHIHLPLQSGSDRILSAMNRNYTQQDYLKIVCGLRARLPQIAVTTDIIVGFPGETEEDFAQTLDVVRQVRFSSSYSFLYSRRPNTMADVRFGKEFDVPPQQAQSRLHRLQQLQNAISLEINREKIGECVEVLVEGWNKKLSSSMRGRTADNIIAEVWGARCQPGELVKAVVESAGPHGLGARIFGASEEN